MNRPLLIMRDHSTRYGLWAESVLEVQADAIITPMPKKLTYFEGVSNYKGTIIPVISLACISGQGNRETGKERVLVILQGAKELVGLTVEEVLHVTEETDEKMSYDNMMLDNGILQIEEIIRQEEPIFVLDMSKILNELAC